MDYKYIHQLLDRYFLAETTLDEESILRAFFRQEDLPAELARYKAVFADDAAQETLSADFDSRMLVLIGEQEQAKTPVIKVVRTRLMPLLRAAAAVVAIVMVGNIARITMPQPADTQGVQTASQSDTYVDPDVAYDKMQGALHLVSEAMNSADSIHNDSIQHE